MGRKLPISLTMSLALALSISPNCFAKLSAEELGKAIKQAKVFGAEEKVQTALAGGELTVSAYRKETSTDNDCKIDAVLTAKAAFAADPELSRVNVLFYDLLVPTDYYEVPVSVGDVVAFGAGKISKEQLLGALKMTKHGSAGAQAVVQPITGAATVSGPATGGTSASAGGSTSGSTPSSTGARSETKPAWIAARLPANRLVYSNYGVTLVYPSDWRIDHPRGSNILARFFMRGNSSQPSIVEMRVYARAAVSPETIAGMSTHTLFGEAWRLAWMKSLSSEFADTPMMQALAEHGRREQHDHDDDEHEHHIRSAPVAIPQTIQIGSKKSLHALQRAYWAEAPLSPREYMRLVVFQSAGYVVQLSLLCPEKDASVGSAQFDQLLAELNAAPPADASGHATKKK